MSWNHSAIKHLVGDGRGDFVDERCAHRWIVAQEDEYFLLLLRWLFLRLGSLHPELFTGRRLVLLDNLIRDHVHDRVLLGIGGARRGGLGMRRRGRLSRSRLRAPASENQNKNKKGDNP